MNDRALRVLASIGLAAGGILGMLGTFAPSDSLRALAWGIDGTALVMAGALLTLAFHRRGQDVIASGFLVFTVGEGIVVSGSAIDLAASAPSFGAGISLWAAGLALISIPRAFPLVVRFLGVIAALLFGFTAVQIFVGIPITAKTSPLPFFAYPVLVATFAGWIWTLVGSRLALRQPVVSAVSS